MNSFRATILFWAVAAWATSGKPLGETDEAGVQKCKDALKLPVLEVLPGGGWDNLRNVDMGRVMELTYTNCRTTEDGQYITPDEIFTIPQKQSNLEMNSEILESWVNYQSSTSYSINTDLSLFSKVNGKFSKTSCVPQLWHMWARQCRRVGLLLFRRTHIKTSFLQDSQEQSLVPVTASAGLAFQHILTKGYLSNRTNSRVQSIGGVPFYPGITLQVWQQGITNHLVAIDRSGLPLHFFINPNMLPDLPGPLVRKVSKTVETAVKRYYMFNTYPGCTDLNSPNFNFQANMDDGSCEGKMTNFSFGGVYQECTQLSGSRDVLLCQKLEQKNPLTGDFSCPSGYSPVHLLSQIHEEGYNHLECHRKCTLLVFCKTVCEDVFQVAKAEFRAFWCVASSQVPENSGLLFGGLFSSKSINPMTNAQSCPAGYFPLRLFENLKVCVSQDYELGSRFAVPFGGFFSCTVGNPLVDPAISRDLEAPSLKKCPGHLALISDGCQVSYCVKSGLFTGGSLPPARLPPFTRPPLMSQAATNTVIVTNSENARSWIKDSQTHQWRLGEPIELRRAMNVIHGNGGGLSGGAAAGVTVGVTTILALVITLAIYGTRKFKKKTYQEIEERQSLVPGTAATGDTPDEEQGRSPA
uniref:Macrophage-expressed gene 1 protein n=1 Tax=Rhinopithecus bieti TaxID=61621 RepID=A0A2K6L121_RHIBE